MSAPDTNIEQQARRHRGPLTGIALALSVAVLGFLIWLAMVAAGGNAPGDSSVVGEEQVAPGVVIEERAAPSAASPATD